MDLVHVLSLASLTYAIYEGRRVSLYRITLREHVVETVSWCDASYVKDLGITCIYSCNKDGACGMLVLGLLGL